MSASGSTVAGNGAIKPQNFEEKLVWYSILGTYVLFFMGAQFVVIPALAWFLALRVFKKRFWDQTEDTPEAERINIPVSVWIWLIGMAFIEIALIMGGFDWDLGITKIIGATLNWSRVWALLALFPLIGACYNIRPQLLYRAVCILCGQSLFFIFVAKVLQRLNIYISYVSPIWKLFGGDSSPYSVHLFIFDHENGQFRLNLFTPFANSLGLVGCVYFFMALKEPNKRWRWIGMIGAAAMVIGSGSRMTSLYIVVIPILTWVITNLHQPILQMAAGISSFFAGIFSPSIIEFLQAAWDRQISGTRSASAVVRVRLRDMTLDAWKEAPIWGHTVIEAEGPHYTGRVPIGTHNQWPDVLYVTGAVGFVAFFVPMMWTLIEMFVRAKNSETARVAFGIFVTFWMVTLAGNIEANSYIYWPGLIITGIAFAEKRAPARSQNLTLVNS